MAYTYVSALAREFGIDAVWETVNLSSMDINTIYSTYADVYLTLSNPIYSSNVYLDFSTVRSMIGVQVPGKTIPLWLNSLGNKALPTFLNAPVFTTQNVLFKDAWFAGYTIQASSYLVSPNAQLPAGALNDLLLTKDNIDYTYMQQHAMVSVNGLFHNIGSGPNGLYVVGGAMTGRITNENQIGILSFENVGALTYLPITDAMIYNNRAVEPLGKFTYVDLGQDVSNKTLLLVLGGHLHIMDEAYSIIGTGLVRINFDRIPWAQVFYDSLDNIDMSTVTWNSTSNNPEQIPVADLYGDAVIEAFLKLTQSFFVIVNAPSMYVAKHYCERAKLPGRWMTAIDPEYPLIGPVGKVIEYVPQWENTEWVLRGRNEYDKNYFFETAPWMTKLSIAPNLVSEQPIEFAKAYLLELGVQTVTTV